MAMIQNGYAAPNSQNSSGFDVGTWTWFVSKQTPTPSPSATIAPPAVRNRQLQHPSARQAHPLTRVFQNCPLT